MNGGLGSGVSGLSRLVAAQSRAITPENFTGAKGAAASATEGAASAAARDLGRGWKVSPFVYVPAGSTFELAAIEGPGVIRQIWLTPAGCAWRHLIIRMYWDGQAGAERGMPAGRLLRVGLGRDDRGRARAGVLAAGVRESGQRAQLLLGDAVPAGLPDDDRESLGRRGPDYYQVNYELREVPARTRPTSTRSSGAVTRSQYQTEHVILDDVRGRGHYVGTYLAWGSNSSGWWGEGEVKFYLDGDDEWPTIASTGTEDYFLRLLQLLGQGRYTDVHHAVLWPAAGDHSGRQ